MMITFVSIDEKKSFKCPHFSINILSSSISIYVFFGMTSVCVCGVNASGRFSYPPRMAVVLISNKFFVRKIDPIRPEQDAVTAHVQNLAQKSVIR